MKLCSKCAVDMEEFYFWMYMFTKGKCECCKQEDKVCFDINAISGRSLA